MERRRTRNHARHLSSSPGPEQNLPGPEQATLDLSTLQPTAHVHEAFLRLTRGKTPDRDGRAHFFAVAGPEPGSLQVHQDSEAVGNIVHDAAGLDHADSSNEAAVRNRSDLIGQNARWLVEAGRSRVNFYVQRVPAKS